MKKLFRNLMAIILSVFMMAGNSTVCVDAISDQGSDQLNNKVNSFKLTDADGKDASEVKANTSYKLSLNFAEKGTEQFNTSEMYYEIPKGINLTLQPDPSSFDMDVTKTDSSGNSYTVKITDNTYTVENGKIKVQWNPQQIDELKGTINAQFSIQANAVFDGTQQEYDINGDGKTDITVDTDHDVTVSKYGYYDSSRKQMHYTATATSSGQNTNVKVTDTVKGSLLSLHQNTWDMTITRNGQTVSDLNASLNSDGKGFTCDVGNMSDKEVIKFDYYADIDFNSIGTGQNLTADKTENDVTVQKDGKPDTSSNPSVVDHIDYSTISKTAGTPGDANENGVRTVPWTIEINKEQGKDLSGTTLSDTINTDSQSFTKYSGTGITIQKIDQNGNAEGEPKTVTWSELNVNTSSASSWSYTFPAGTGNFGYRVTYTTDVDASQFKVVTKVNNTTTTTSTGRQATGSVDVKPSDTELKLGKEVLETNWDSVKWRYTITVPKSGTNKAVVTDTLPSVYIDGMLYDTLKSTDDIKIEGKLSNETSDIVLKDANDVDTTDLSKAVKFVITFKHDGIDGFASSEKDREINVTYETNNNTDWLNKTENVHDYRATHKNKVAFDYGSAILDADADAVPVKSSISKAVSHFSGDSIYSEVSDKNGNVVKVPVWKFAVTLQGVHSGPITIKDTYDESLKGLVKVADNSDLKDMRQNGKHAAFLYYGDYAPNDYWPEISNIDVRSKIEEKNDSGFTFNLDDNDIPKKDNGGYYNYYTLFYVLVPKSYSDYQKIEQKAAESENSELKMKNNVTWGSLSSGADFSYTYPNVEKTIKYYTQGNDGKPSQSVTDNSGVLTAKNNKVKFTLEVNPDGKNIASGQKTYTLTDTFTSGNISPYADSIKIKDKDNKDITKDCKFDLKQNGSGIVFTLPDSQALTITYDAFITSNGSGEYANKIVNSAEINGYTSTIEGTSKIDWNATGSSEHVTAVIRKSVYGNLQKTIPGAKYTLYDGNGSQGDKGVKVSGPFTTDKNGKATITGRDLSNGNTESLFYEHSYYLMETEAPEGYQKDTTPHVFQLVKDPGKNLPNQVTAGTEIILSDKVENFRIVKHGSDNKPLAGATFTLSGGDLTEDQVVTTGDDGVASFSGLTGGKSYTLTETSAPSGYKISGPWTIELSDDLKPNSETLKFSNSTANGITAYSATVTDQKTPVSITGHKVWNDGGETRPEKVKLALQKLNKQTNKYETEQEQDVGPGEDNQWSYKFDNVDPDGTYQVIEENTGEDYQSSVGTKDNNWEVVNTKTGTINIPVRKVWKNGSAAAVINLIRRHKDSTEKWQSIGQQEVLTTGNNAEHTFTNLPLYDEQGLRYEYSVSEVPLKGYKPEISGSQDEGFIITNIKLDTSANVNATKKLVGRALAAGEFTFRLAETDADYKEKSDGVTETAVNEADGSVHFNALNYSFTQITPEDGSQPDDSKLGDDHYYVLSEVSDNKEGHVTYDTNKYRVHVHNYYDSSESKMKSSVEYLMSSDNGATWTPVDQSNVIFTNTYTPESATAELSADKNVIGRENVNETFNLKLEALDGAPMPEDATGLDKIIPVKTGKVDFGKISYTQAGTYRYRISEVDQDPSVRIENGYEYDKSVYEATVKVTDQNGALHAEVAYQIANNTDDSKGDKTVSIPTFTNKFSWSPVAAKLRVTKGFTERTSGAFGTNGQTFTFTVRSDNKDIETQSITAQDGTTQTIDFDKLSFDKPGTYTATIYENDLTTDQNNAGWIKDGRSYTVTFEVAENTIKQNDTDVENGMLHIAKATVNGKDLAPDSDGYYKMPGSDGDDKPTFVNDYDQGVTTEYLHISKYVSGYPSGKVNNDSFSFNIRAEKKSGKNWQPVTDSALSGSDVTSKGNGNYTVTGVREGNPWTSNILTFNEEGEYKYTITEDDKIDKKSYYKYSDDTYEVDIKVTKDENGKLTHTTTYTRDKGKDKSGDYAQKDGKIDIAQFINEYQLKPVTIYPAVWKKMVSSKALEAVRKDSNARFTFILTGSDDNPDKQYDSSFKMKAVVNKDNLTDSDNDKTYVRFKKVNKDGSVSDEEGLTFDHSYGADNVYTFNVTENDPGKPYTKDDAVYQAKFDLQDNGDGTQSIRRMQITRNGADVYYAYDNNLNDIKVTDYADVAIPNVYSQLKDVPEDSEVKKHIRQNTSNTYEADIRFTDDYVPATTSAEISVAKILKGYPEKGLNSYSFNFELKGSDYNKKLDPETKYDGNFSDRETIIVGNINGKNQKNGSVKFMSDSTASNTKFVFEKAGVYEFTIDEKYTDDSYKGIKKEPESTPIHVFIDVTDNSKGKLNSAVYYTRDNDLIKSVEKNHKIPENASEKCLHIYQSDKDGMDENNQTASFHNTYKAESAVNADFTMHKGFNVNGDPISTNPDAADKDFYFRITPSGDATKLNYEDACNNTTTGCKFDKDKKSMILTDHILTQNDIEKLKKKYSANTDWKLDKSNPEKSGYRDLQAGDEQLDGREENGLNKPKRSSSGKLTQGVYFKTPDFTEPGTYVYRIDEVPRNYENYSTDSVYYYATFVVTDNGTGKLTATEQHTSSTDLNGTSTGTSIRFHNKYVPEETTAEINVKKIIQDSDGNEFSDDEFSDEVKKKIPFTFTLTGSDENVDSAYKSNYSQSITINGNGEGKFDLPITIDPTIDSKKDASGYYDHYVFNLKEEPGTINGFTYDSKQYKVEFDVRDVDGKLKVSDYKYTGENVENNKYAEFTNTYEVKPATAVISGTKLFTDNMPAGTADGLKFNFTMKPAGSTVGSDMPADGLHAEAVIGQNNNKFEFNPIKYTRAGIYKYVITEDDLPGDDPRYVNLKKSNDTHYATVSVTDDGAGVLNSSVIVDNKEASNDGSDPALTIVNTYTSKDITVYKRWNDGHDENNVRPEVQDFINSLKLYDGDKEVTGFVPEVEQSHKDQDVYNISYRNLPKYGKDGKEIVYTVKENPVNGYTSDQNDHGAGDGQTITNTLLTQLSGVKIWNDNDDQDGIRPDSVTIQLYADNVKKDEAVTDAAHEWKYAFNNLPAYDKDGNKIIYSVSEEKVKGYTLTVNGTDITNTYTPGTTAVPVRKVWSDHDNLTGKRPDSVKVQLTQTIDGKQSDVKDRILILSEKDQWHGTFDNLPVKSHGKDIIYGVKELDYKNSDAYQNVKIEKDADGGFTLTNKVKTGGLKIRKILNGATVPKKKMNSLHFTIMNKNTGKIVAELNYSDMKKGEYVLNNLPAGTYTVTEENPEIEGFAVLASVEINDQKADLKSGKISTDVQISDDKKNSETTVTITDTYSKKKHPSEDKHPSDNKHPSEDRHQDHQSKKDNSPDTRDYNHPYRWASMMIGGILLAVLTLITRRKYSR